MGTAALARGCAFSSLQAITPPHESSFSHIGETPHFRFLRERIGLPAEELCFIDDVEKNVNGACAAGWNAIRFVTNDQVEADFEKLSSR